MALVVVDVRFDVKTPQWVIDNPSIILDPGEPLFLTNMTFTLGDSTTPLSGLTFSSVGGDTVFQNDILVSLSGGKTLGKYTTGQTIPSAGKTPEQVLNMIGIEDIFPTYVIPTLTLNKGATTKAEVGTAYSHNLTATFGQNDAGALNVIHIEKNGVLLGTAGASSPFVRSDSGNYILGNITYQSFAGYDSGIIKNMSPSGTPDPRTPTIRSVNAPQAADTNFASNTQVLTGVRKIFFGPNSGSVTPTNSAGVRALGSQFDDTLTGILNTGTVEKSFTVAAEAGKNLVSVIDLDALNADITSQYVLNTFNVNDAGGNAISYHVLTMTAGVPYATSHRHQFTFA